jgi:RNA polymerase sigma-70 factor (sigma-E family)
MELLGLVAGRDAAGPVTERLGFTAFYQATWARMYRTAYGITRDRTTAEDALQSAYAKAFSSWRRVTAADEPEAYLRRMVVNEVLGAKRRSGRRPEHLTDSVESVANASADGSQEGYADREALWTALGQLPPRQRAVIVLRYYEDLSEAQIADALRCSQGTVKSQASSALANLRRIAGPTFGSQS